MFQHVKQYRQRHGLTQEALGELMGVNPKFIYSLEKHRPRTTHEGEKVVYTPQEKAVLSFLFGTTPKNPDFFNTLPTLTAQDFTKIRNGRKFTTVGWMIGISASQWSLVESGKSKEDQPQIRRWYTLLLMVHFPEYFANLTPADETPMVEAQACNVASVVPNVASEPVMLPANVAGDDFADQPGLIPFAYGSQKVRVKWIDNKPWFMLSDVCRAIGYKSTQHAISLIRERDLQKVECIDSFGRVQFANFVSQPGMSQFFLRARVPAVEPFEDWVFDELLPSVYKTGQYQLTPQAQIDPIDAAILSLQRIKQIEAVQMEQQKRQAELEQQIKQIAIASPADADKVANNAVQKIQALNTKRRELQILVSAIVGYAKDSPKAFAHSYRNYQQVWHFVFDKSNPPVNKLADYTTHAQINTGIDAARNLLSELTGKTQTEQLKINIESDEIA